MKVLPTVAFSYAILPWLIWLCGAHASADDANQSKSPLTLQLGGRHFADYVFKDPAITRPYFCNVKSPGGIQVTRNHPVKPGDKDDHQTMHPGMWLSFGDISGHDYWRLRAVTQHVRFVNELTNESNGHRTFTVENAYKSSDGRSTVCREVCRYDLQLIEQGTLLIATSEFTGEKEFTFGDQEEMGFGVRLATPISVDEKSGGRILDSEGRLNGRGVWGKQAAWCDYSGLIGDKRVGVSLFPSPKNFRASWWHARDYGFVAANPFGKAAFERGEKSKIVVKPGTRFRIQFGILVHGSLSDDRSVKNEAMTIRQAYDSFIRKIEQE